MLHDKNHVHLRCLITRPQNGRTGGALISKEALIRGFIVNGKWLIRMELTITYFCFPFAQTVDAQWWHHLSSMPSNSMIQMLLPPTDKRFYPYKWSLLNVKFIQYVVLTFVWYCRLEVALETSQAKQRDLWTWHERCDTLYRWVNDRYGRLGPRPPSPKESLGGIKRQESVIEVKARTMKIHVFWSVHELGISPHYN